MIYTGLCLGGPRDGLMQAHAKRMFRVVEHEDFEIRKLYDEIPKEAVSRTIEYSYLEMKFVARDASGFWICDTIRNHIADEKDVVEYLVRAYAARSRGRG